MQVKSDYSQYPVTFGTDFGSNLDYEIIHMDCDRTNGDMFLLGTIIDPAGTLKY